MTHRAKRQAYMKQYGLERRRKAVQEGRSVRTEASKVQQREYARERHRRLQAESPEYRRAQAARTRANKAARPPDKVEADKQREHERYLLEREERVAAAKAAQTPPYSGETPEQWVRLILDRVKGSAQLGFELG